jgi:cytochrome b pre-mRNA-processing protein 3
MGVLRFLLGGRHERAGHALYAAAVTAARAPYYYTVLAVPDTLDGRFDLVGLHAFLVIRRLTALPPPGPALAQAVFDAMFGDMDINLREMGVGDLSVGKRVREMWEAFHGRAKVYQAALAAGDADGLAEALARNVWRGAAPDGAAAALAKLALAQDAHLAAQELAALKVGRVDFRLPEPVA